MSPATEKVSNIIPNDLILFSILSKLPVKSLKRFSCVCKSWVDLFENPQFIMKLYIINHENDNSCILMQSIHSTDSLFMLFGERYQNKVRLDWPSPFQEDNEDINILGSLANGTICLYEGRGHGLMEKIPRKVVLLNPTTKEVNVIPFDFDFDFDCPVGIDMHVDFFGFGYDPVAQDHKLIRHFEFSRYYSPDYIVGSIFPEPLWQIYSRRSNSWRKLDLEIPTIKYTFEKVYLNGMCHWWGYKQSNRDVLVLVSFNLSDEVVHTTPLNCNDAYDVSFWSRTMVVFKNSIAMITKYAGTTCFELSILGEIGVKESWIKLFTIGPLHCVAYPIGVWKNDMFFRKEGFQLAYINLSTQLIEEIGENWLHCQLYLQGKSSSLLEQ